MFNTQAKKTFNGRLRLILVGLVLIAGFYHTTSAEHALSEVWSEGDGLHLKYMTNHDDLLSTKGSELSLSSDRAPTKQQVSTADGNSGEQDEASNSGEEGNSANSQEQQEKASESPESSSGITTQSGSNSDSDGGAEEESKRQSNRVPLKQVKASEQQGRGESSSGGDDDADEESQQQRTRSQVSSDSNPDVGSFSAAQEQDEEQTGGGGDESSSADPGEYSPSAGRSVLESEKPRAFKAPIVRSFKEIPQAKQWSGNNRVAEVQSDASHEQQESADSGDADGSSGATTGSSNNDTPLGALSENSVEEPTGTGEPEFNVNTEQERSDRNSSPFPRQNLIDFDRISNAQAGASAGAGVINTKRGSGMISPLGRQRVGAEFGRTSHHYQEQQRHLAAGSTHRERPASQPGMGAGQPAGKPLAYFRSLDKVKPSASLKSPDEERDNFISPGHYPGSMAHLTQAASETQKKELEPIEGKSSSVEQTQSSDNSKKLESEQQQMDSSQQQKAIVASDSTLQLNEEQQVTPIKKPSGAEEETRVQVVTPEPDAQPESQQIMAPLLMSTTTMAPITEQQQAVANNATSSSSSGKRFKSRKYR